MSSGEPCSRRVTDQGSASAVEIVPGLWRFAAVHPEWEQGEDWEPEVAWWALRTPVGVVLIDPLVDNWDELDAIVEAAGECAAVVRTCWWHERSVDAARVRYRTEVWAREPPATASGRRPDHSVGDGARLPGGLQAFSVVRDDELAVWLPDQRALVFGDVMVRNEAGVLSMCPESWVTRVGGHPALRSSLQRLLSLPVAHVFVSHGPLVLGDGHAALGRAIR